MRLAEPPLQRLGFALGALGMDADRGAAATASGLRVGCGGDAMLNYLISLPRRLIPPEVRGRIRVALRLPSRGRREANAWLRQECASVQGKVLSIGSGNDSDGLGDVYRSYFPNAESYTTSEVAPGHDTDLIIDVRDMRDIPDASYDAVFCCGVLEHVDDCYRSMDEISRILAPGGILLLGLPFRQGIHMEPNDYWRFTEFITSATDLGPVISNSQCR